MSIVSSAMDLPQAGAEVDTKQKTKDRLHKWYIEHGKAQRVRKRVRHHEQSVESGESDASSTDSEISTKHVQRKKKRRTKTDCGTPDAEHNTMNTVMSAALCMVGGFGIVRTSYENKDAILNLGNSF